MSRMNAEKEDERKRSSSIEDLECNFSARMNYCVEQVGSASALAKKAGISQSGIRRYFTGGEPSRPHLVAIAKAAGVSIEWLATGEGPMVVEYGQVAQKEPVSVEELGAHFEYARKAAVEDIASNQDAPSAIPMTLYARLAGPLADTVPDLEGQREAVLGRCIAMLRAVTDDEPVEMLQFSEEDLAQIVEVAMTGYRIACERRGVYPHV